MTFVLKFRAFRGGRRWVTWAARWPLRRNTPSIHPIHSFVHSFISMAAAALGRASKRAGERASHARPAERKAVKAETQTRPRPRGVRLIGATITWRRQAPSSLCFGTLPSFLPSFLPLRFSCSLTVVNIVVRRRQHASTSCSAVSSKRGGEANNTERVEAVNWSETNLSRARELDQTNRLVFVVVVISVPLPVQKVKAADALLQLQRKLWLA